MWISSNDISGYLPFNAGWQQNVIHIQRNLQLLGAGFSFYDPLLTLGIKGLKENAYKNAFS